MLFVQTRILPRQLRRPSWAKKLSDACGSKPPKSEQRHRSSYSPCNCDTNGSSKYQGARVLDPWYRHLVAQRAPGKAPGRAPVFLSRRAPWLDVSRSTALKKSKLAQDTMPDIDTFFVWIYSPAAGSLLVGLRKCPLVGIHPYVSSIVDTLKRWGSARLSFFNCALWIQDSLKSSQLVILLKRRKRKSSLSYPHLLFILNTVTIKN